MPTDSAKILVVDDESGMRKVLTAKLKDQGHRVIACGGGKEALQYVQETPLDVVIADLRLPDGSGLEILETLKEINPEVAFILMTGYATVETAVEALNEGAFAYITKPFSMDELYTIIRKALRQQKLLREHRRLVEDLQQSNKELNKMVNERKRAERALAQQAEELARSNAELEQFASVASHDLHEPLRMVTGYLQLLQRRYQGRLDADADQFIAHAVDGAIRMQALISGLLAYSRVGTRGKPFEPTDCVVVFQEAIANLLAAVKESGAVVTYEALPTVMADATQLTQLFQNLIGNAIKFRSHIPPEIHIGAEPREGEWVFSVRDNGIGIDPKYADCIFLIFQRLHTRSEYPGTGIGLAICKKIVERHGGCIWVESEPGKGSTLRFTIPDRGDNRS